MGYASIGAKSTQQLQRHIRTVAKSTSSIILLKHAKAQMVKRKFLQAEVYEILRSGKINRTPEPNSIKGSLECRMEFYVAGRNCAVIVALCDEQPDLIVVTVMLIN